MIRYLTHNQIDKSLWDECVEQSPDGLVYVWSWYLDAVHPGWEALVEDDYKAVMPLTSGNKFCVNYLFQPFFTQKFGVFGKTEVTEEKIEQFFEAIPGKFKFAEFRINNSYETHRTYTTYTTENHRNIELSLNQNYFVLAENYHSNTKRNLAKAKKQGLMIVENAKPSAIIELFRKNRGKEIKHWGDKEYNRLLSLVEAAKNHSACFVLGVQNPDNQLIAGAFFMISHHKIVFLFSGTDEANKELHGLTFLLDYVIEKYSGTDFTLDFEGSDNDGLARFYKGFGGEEKYYRELKFNKLNKIYKFALKIFKNNKI
ncbi:MAG: GNAT family N-acetyltransferase [Bacteroidales bacterium]|nr:GNAT family N-acetyltransferase [Bacteroidales bacterium]